MSKKNQKSNQGGNRKAGNGRRLNGIGGIDRIEADREEDDRRFINGWGG
jgi:hypothetical protein